jgi:prefoldin alpha subunit
MQQVWLYTGAVLLSDWLRCCIVQVRQRLWECTCTGGEILVPLTSSLYVPGKIAASTEVLVDIGTGFYVGKSPKDAAEIMSKKSDMVRKQADQLGKVINVKQSNMEIINNFIEHKQQEGRSGSAGGEE